jgi:hypothetical protein
VVLGFELRADLSNCHAQRFAKLAKEEMHMNIIPLQICLHLSNQSAIKKQWLALRNRFVPLALYRDEYHYIAEAIAHEGSHYYRVDGTTVELGQHEYQRVIANPRLYYFSATLKLHHRIKRAKVLGLGAHWPDQPAASLTAIEPGGKS